MQHIIAIAVLSFFSHKKKYFSRQINISWHFQHCCHKIKDKRSWSPCQGWFSNNDRTWSLFPLLKWHQTLESNLCIIFPNVVILLKTGFYYIMQRKKARHEVTNQKQVYLSQISFFGVGQCILSWQPRVSEREDQHLFHPFHIPHILLFIRLK